MAVLECIPELPATGGGFVPAVIVSRPGSASGTAGPGEEIAARIVEIVQTATGGNR